MRSSVRARLAPPCFQPLADPAAASLPLLCCCLCRNPSFHPLEVNPRGETDLNDTRAIGLSLGRSVPAGVGVWGRGRLCRPLALGTASPPGMNVPHRNADA